MQEPRLVLFDSGRYPLLFRALALIAAAFCLWMAISLTVFNLFGMDLFRAFGANGHLHASHGFELPFVVAGCMANAAGFSLPWFLQTRLLFDAELHGLAQQTRYYFRTYESHVSLNDCCEFEGRKESSILSSTTRFYAIFSDGRRNPIIAITNSERIEPFMALLAATAKLPVSIK